MAQQGGTYRVPAKTKVATPVYEEKIDSQESAVEKSGDPAPGTEVDVAWSDSSCPACGHDKSDQWELVANPEDGKETEPCACGFSSHFDLTIGWGRWKTTVFSWDVNVRKPAGRCRYGSECKKRK